VRRGCKYQDVKPAELIPNELREPGGAGGVGDIELVEENLGVAAGPPDALDRFQTPRLIPRRQDDPEPLGRQLPARLQPDPLVPSGHQRDPDCTGKKATGLHVQWHIDQKGARREIHPAHLLLEGLETAASMAALRFGVRNTELERIQAPAPFPENGVFLCCCQTARSPPMASPSSQTARRLAAAVGSHESFGWALGAHEGPMLHLGLAALRQQRSRLSAFGFLTRHKAYALQLINP